jgi:uncharacterized protein YgiM (DUF1202 family)
MKKFITILLLALCCAGTASAAAEAVRPGLYAIDDTDIEEGVINLSDENKQNEASIFIKRNFEDFLSFKGTADIVENKVTIKSSKKPDALIIVTIKDGTAILEANSEAEEMAYGFGEGNVLPFSGIYRVTYYENLNALQLGYLFKSGQLPQYIQNSGKFYYAPGSYTLKINGTNVRLRSEPNTNSRIVNTVNKGEELDLDLSYAGEWTNPHGEKWVLVGYYEAHVDFQIVAWVFGNFVELAAK